MSTGLSEDIGSWKIIAIRLPRTERMPASSSARRSSPSKTILPLSIRPGSGISRRMESAVTLLPDPLSPTIARVSPGATSSDSEVTALTFGPVAEAGAERDVQIVDAKQGLLHGPKPISLFISWSIQSRA